MPTATVASGLLTRIAGMGVSRLLVTGLRDLKLRPSGTLPADEAPLSAAVSALREQGFAGLIGAGTSVFFTRFYRNSLPPSDFAGFSGAAIVHATDDVSVTETVGVIPAVLDSAAALAPPGTPLFPGPLTLAAAVPPCAPSLAANGDRCRRCMAEVDPRYIPPSVPTICSR